MGEKGKPVYGMPAYRDSKSGAIISTDKSAWQKAQKRKRAAVKLKKQEGKIKSQEERINILENQMNELINIINNLKG